MISLTLLKRTSEMTAPQLNEWFSVLGQFPIWILNCAVVEMACSETRFPEVGDLYQICRRIAFKKGVMERPYHPNAKDGDVNITADEIARIGNSLGMKMGPHE